MTEDLLVLPGAVLTIAPGTVLSFDRSESSKVDPEYYFGGTEMVIRGRVEADGAEFRFPERTGGIVVDGGVLSIARTGISGAEAGILVTGGGHRITSYNVCYTKLLRAIRRFAEQEGSADMFRVYHVEDRKFQRTEIPGALVLKEWDLYRDVLEAA